MVDADPRARHPARLEGRLDLSVSERAPAGHRRRRRGPQAVPLPRRLAHAPRRREVRGDDPLRQGAAAAARAGRGRPGRHRQAHPRARAGLRRAAARPRLLPHRHRGVHGHQRVLRAGHDAQAARDDRRRARWSSTIPPRAASGGSRPSSTRWRRRSSARSSAAAAAAPELLAFKDGRDVGRRALGRHQRLPEGRDRRRLLGQGLPDLERDRDRRPRAGGLRPGPRLADTSASARSRAPSRRPRTTSATRPRSAAPPTSTRACSTPTAAGSCSTRR